MSGPDDGNQSNDERWSKRLRLAWREGFVESLRGLRTGDEFFSPHTSKYRHIFETGSAQRA